jgi:putative spermidine/putrescine transport system ATP-binding protein
LRFVCRKFFNQQAREREALTTPAIHSYVVGAPPTMANVNGRGVSLEVSRISKSFGLSRVVQDVSLTVAGGTFLTLLGPSGSGKTTTLRMIAGFEEPTDGDIRVGGKSLRGQPAHKRNIGVVFQQYALFPHLTVFKNVAYPLEMRGCSRSEINRRVAWALDLVRLSGFESRRPSQLSGGQQQRVALARAVVFEPTVLLMDEPMGALDKRLREVMQVEIRHLQQKLGITTISVTHDQVEALVMSDVIAVMNAGAIQQVGTPLEIYQRPANRFVADFIGESNLLSGAIEAIRDSEITFRTEKGLTVQAVTMAEQRPSGSGFLVIRPEHVRLGSAAERAQNSYPAEVRDIHYVGDLVKYRVRLSSDDELIAKTLTTSTGRPWQTGDDIAIGWSSEDCFIVQS